MPFLLKLYRSTRSTQEVLARIRLMLMLSKQPLLFLWPRERTSIERAKSSSPSVLLVLFDLLCLVASFVCSLYRFSGLIVLLPCLSLYRGSYTEDSVDRTRTHWRKETRMTT